MRGWQNCFQRYWAILFTLVLGIILGHPLPLPEKQCKVDFTDVNELIGVEIHVLTCTGLRDEEGVSSLQNLLEGIAPAESSIKIRFDRSSVGNVPDHLLAGHPVTSLFMLSCNLTEIPFRLINPICSRSLTDVYISKNHIHAVPAENFRSCTKVRTMDLSANEIAFLSPKAFLGLDNLLELNLQYNRIQTVAGFEGLGNLRVLFLTYNRITQVEAHAFRGMGKLAILDLSHNRIRSLEEGTLDPLAARDTWDPLQDVYLEGNPLDCNCALAWLQKWINTNRNGFMDPQCATPDGGSLMEILHSCTADSSNSPNGIVTHEWLLIVSFVTLAFHSYMEISGLGPFYGIKKQF